MASLGKALQRSKRATRYQQYAGAQERYAEERAAQLEAEDLQRRQGNNGPPLQSIWECNELDHFLSIADERERGYEAERDTKVVFTSASGKSKVSSAQVVQRRTLLDAQQREQLRANWAKLHARLTIPKRQEWSYAMSAVEVQKAEKEAFVNWRRGLAALEEAEGIVMTPYEKNLEVWRQLWRVVERADVVLEIVDARNPLVYRSADFEKYVAETLHPKTQKPKPLILLLNKADLLTEDQRRAWVTYFEEKGDRFFFFSAKPEFAAAAVADASGSGTQTTGESDDDDNDNTSEEEDEEEEEAAGSRPPPCKAQDKSRHKAKRLRAPVNVSVDPYALAEQRRRWKEQHLQPKEKVVQPLTKEEKERNARMQANLEKLHGEPSSGAVSTTLEPWTVLNPVQLIDQLALLRVTCCGVQDDEVPLMAGLVGYPNVGKSSTINALIGAKKVVVSATPGKTKHFQTLPIPNERRIALCDCPGLVFPSFATTKEEMLCDGILPADHTTDATPAVSVLCRRLPRRLLEELLCIALDAEADPDRSATLSERLLNAYARRRGYFASHDRPNQNRAGKELLKWYVDGALVYAEPPPTYKPSVHELTIESLLDAKRQAEAVRAAGRSQKKGGHGPPPSIAGPVTPASKVCVAGGDKPNAEGDGESSGYEDEGSWCTEDEAAWEALDEAAAARALSDAGDDRSQDSEMDDDDLQEQLPFFFARPPHMQLLFTRQEAFNQRANEARIAALLAQAESRRQRARKRAGNAQLMSDVPPDVYTFINREGEVELRIDDDDGVIELVAPDGAAVKQKTGAGWHSRPGAPPPLVLDGKAKKPLSKRQQRRQWKKENGGLIASGKGATKVNVFD